MTVISFLADALVALIIFALALSASGLLAVLGMILFALNVFAMTLKTFGWKTASIRPNGIVTMFGYKTGDSNE